MGQALTSNFAFLPPPCSYNPDFPSAFIDSHNKFNSRIPLVYFKAQKKRALPITVLFSHGNAEDIGQMNGWMKVIRDICRVNICFYDYSGYGLNTPASPSEACVFNDIEKVFAYLLTEKQIPPSCIILFGRSLGSGPTTYLASRLCKDFRELHSKKVDPPPRKRRLSSFSSKNKSLKTEKEKEKEKEKHHECENYNQHDHDHDHENKPRRFMPPLGGVILQSPLLSCIKTISESLSKLKFFDMFTNFEIIHHISVPTLIYHGTNDRVVPFHHGETLFNRLSEDAKYSFTPFQNAGHNDIEIMYQGELLAILTEFVDGLEKSLLE